MNSQQNNWKQWLAAGMLVTASVFTGCQSSSDYKSIDSDAPAGDATTMDSTQGNQVDESMTSRDNVSDRPVTNPDGSTNPDAATNKSSALPKKGTKGRASINMESMRGSKTTSAMRDADGIYSRADVMPMYPGGEDALQKFVEDNIEYPDQAIENGAEGDVRVVFTVDEKGRVTNIKATGDNNVEYGMKEEAVAVMNKMPAWTPGKVNGKSVKTRMTLPIVYRIEQ
jgi:periplasmic protein TonB